MGWDGAHSAYSQVEMRGLAEGDGRQCATLRVHKKPRIKGAHKKPPGGRMPVPGGPDRVMPRRVSAILWTLRGVQGPRGMPPKMTLLTVWTMGAAPAYSSEALIPPLTTGHPPARQAPSERSREPEIRSSR